MRNLAWFANQVILIFEAIDQVRKEISDIENRADLECNETICREKITKLYDELLNKELLHYQFIIFLQENSSRELVETEEKKIRGGFKEIEQAFRASITALTKRESHNRQNLMCRQDKLFQKIKELRRDNIAAVNDGFVLVHK